MRPLLTLLVRSAVLSILGLAHSSCAYHAGSGDRQVPGGYLTIAVPVFKNFSRESGSEVYFTNAFVQELERSRVGRIAPKENAQTVLEGVITSIKYVPTNTVTDRELRLPGETVLNTSYRVVVTTALRLVRSADGKVLWEGAFEKERTYLTPRVGLEPLTGVNALYNHSARSQTIQTIAYDMMAEAHDRLTERF